jgi:hypothetical protein
VERGKGIPKEREVDKRREVCEWEGCVCVCEAIGAPSRLIRKAVWPLRDVKTELFVEMSNSNVKTEAFFCFFLIGNLVFWH